MEKVITIPDEIVKDLKIMAAEDNKNLTKFITSILVMVVDNNRRIKK